jgi:uncharacterized protein with NAD-binding domain and iron-sulfur cluster
MGTIAVIGCAVAASASSSSTASTTSGSRTTTPASRRWTCRSRPRPAATTSISPLDGTYDNLTIAGDWTACGLNVGCVEAAVISGRLAAHAIAQQPALADIIGYDHP